jgi:hypothetical protein
VAILSTVELRELDRQIDSYVTAQPLLSVPRDIAAVHTLRVYEDYVRLMVPAAAQGLQLLDFLAACKCAQDGMHFAALWVYGHCRGPTQRLRLATQPELYEHASDLFRAAMDYSTVWDYMTQLFRKRAVGERASDGSIRLRAANQVAPDIDIASRILSQAEQLEHAYTAAPALATIEPQEILPKIIVCPSALGKVRYRVPETVFQRVYEAQCGAVKGQWQLDPSWDFGGYTLAQFRKLWVALVATCWIHHWMCLCSGQPGGALDSVVRVRKRDRWEEELADRTGLDRAIVSTILNDLVYEPALYEPARKNPDVTCQPFFPLWGERLALSNQLVLHSNAERNLWDLLSIKREALHARLRNEKERLWMGELRSFLESRGLRVVGPLRFCYGGEDSDLDMLVVDERDSFAVGLELKWLTHPDRIKDIQYVDAELERGIEQARLALRWLDSRPDRLRRSLASAPRRIDQLEFRTAVLSKNTVGSAWVDRSGVPILNERLTRWVLGDPHNRTLRALWYVGEERRYMPKRGRHFVDCDLSVDFGGIRFVGEDMAMRLKARWEAADDIDFRGLG